MSPTQPAQEQSHERIERPEAVLESTSSDLTAVLTAVLAAGGSASFSIHFSPSEPAPAPDAAPPPPETDGEGQGSDWSHLQAPGRRSSSFTFLGVSGGRPAKRIYGLGQRVRVPHLGVEGVVNGITNWENTDPDYNVRWSDNQVRPRDAWFKNEEIEPLD